MEFFIEKQILNIVYSVILGLIFGAIYDIIRIIYVMCGIASYRGGRVSMKRGAVPFVIFALFDLSVFTVFTAVYSVFDYWTENERFRAYILVSVILGFVLYRKTVGRAVMFVSEEIARLIKKLIRLVIVKPCMWLFGIIKKAAAFIWSRTGERVICGIKKLKAERKTRKMLAELKHDIAMEKWLEK